MTTPFARHPGTTQKRIEPQNSAPILDDFVFVLGSDAPGVVHRFVNNDEVLVEQTGDVTGLKLIKFQAKLRAPSEYPAQGLNTLDGSAIAVAPRWRFSWGVDASEHGFRYLEAGKSYDIKDGAIDVSQVTGNHTVRFRLRIGA